MSTYQARYIEIMKTQPHKASLGINESVRSQDANLNITLKIMELMKGGGVPSINGGNKIVSTEGVGGGWAD